MANVYTGVIKATILSISKGTCPQGMHSLASGIQMYTSENDWAKQNITGFMRKKLLKALEEHRGQRQQINWETS